MYKLLCKDNVVAVFDLVEEVVGTYHAVVTYYDEKYWMLTDVDTWLHNRSAAKHRKSVEDLLKLAGIRTLKGFIDYTKCLSLTDCFWVCDVNSSLTWSSVNLYVNSFDDVMSRLAFDNGLYGAQFSSTVPDATTDGALEKCWVRRENGTFLVKEGTTGCANTGNEPYSEQYCSDLLDVLEFTHVRYGAGYYKGHLACSCRLMTSEDSMLLSFANWLDKYDIKYILDKVKTNGLLDKFTEYIIFDYLVVNDDRHLNNIGILVNTDTLKITGMAPIFDNGCGLLPYAMASDFKDIDGYINLKGPRFYNSFYGLAKELLTREIRSKLHKLLQFKFRRDHSCALPEWRLKALEKIVQQRAGALLK